MLGDCNVLGGIGKQGCISRYLREFEVLGDRDIL